MWVAESSSRNEVVDFAGFVLKIMRHVRDCRGARVLNFVFVPTPTATRLRGPGPAVPDYGSQTPDPQTQAPSWGSIYLDHPEEILVRLEKCLMIFQPETVIGWQRAGFRLFWRWKSRRRHGRPSRAGDEGESEAPDTNWALDDRPKGRAALSRPTSLKPPTLTVVP
jgi:hypothetical protein